MPALGDWPFGSHPDAAPRSPRPASAQKDGDVVLSERSQADLLRSCHSRRQSLASELASPSRWTK